jgi:hypothetical protein
MMMLMMMMGARGQIKDGGNRLNTLIIHELYSPSCRNEINLILCVRASPSLTESNCNYNQF